MNDNHLLALLIVFGFGGVPLAIALTECGDVSPSGIAACARACEPARMQSYSKERGCVCLELGDAGAP